MNFQSSPRSDLGDIRDGYYTLVLLFFIVLPPLSIRACPSVSGQNAEKQSIEKINVTEFLRECREVSVKKAEESRRRLESYTFKTRKTLRKQSRNGGDSSYSEVFEVYPPPFRKRRGGEPFDTRVLIEKNGKPVSPERIEKERLKVGRDLEKFGREPDPIMDSSPMSMKPGSTDWFNISVNKIVRIMPFANERIEFLGDEFFDKCEFNRPYAENIRERDTVALRFRARPDSVFGEKTKYLSNFEGVVWVDAADKFIFRLAAWPQGATFDANDSDHLLENAAVAIDYARTKEGMWFRRMIRMNAVKYPKAFLWLKLDFLLEHGDYKLYSVDSEKARLSVPEKK
jgi:hypothetical protein